MIHWYILHSKPNKEEFVLQQLGLRNIIAYYPYIKAEPANPRSRKIKPYFPGYLFVNANLDLVGTSTLKWIPGTLGLVSFGNELATVSDELLQPIRDHIDQINQTYRSSFKNFSPGDRVVIQSGPFAGYQAIFDAYVPGQERVQVLLQMLQDRKLKLDLDGVSVTRMTVKQASGN